MNRIIKQHKWLYLLTALLLLMQSFAIWHDVEHPFHVANDQCQRFESISHTPTIALAISIIPEFTAQYGAVEPTINIAYVSKRLRDNHAIRAPPLFS